MIEDAIAEIESRLHAADLADAQRAGLQTQLQTLKTELSTTKNPHTIKAALDGLSTSVAGLEAQHPKLTELVGSLSLLLSSSGI